MTFKKSPQEIDLVAKNKILDATNGIVAILEPLESDERARVIQAAMTVLGESDLPTTVYSDKGSGGSQGGGGDPMSAREFFESKAPKSKVEELATAARYREEYEDAEASTKAELHAVIKAARRNFDDNNFRRDIDNARTRGLFNKGTGKDSAVLSHYGQNYVDAMPDREAVKKLQRPTRKKATKKKAAKKTARR